jgi:hypothetical protein
MPDFVLKIDFVTEIKAFSSRGSDLRCSSAPRKAQNQGWGKGVSSIQAVRGNSHEASLKSPYAVV